MTKLPNKNFVLLWQGQFVNNLGSQAFVITMAISGIIADLTGQNIPAIYLTCGSVLLVLSV